MIVLDTNVISELTRRLPDHGVQVWLDSMADSEILTTAVTAAELLYGVTRLPQGHRRTILTEAVQGLLADDFRGRIEPFDADSAVEYAVVVADREITGRPISVADAQIAAICRRLHAPLATRNTRDFEGTGIDLVNPWHVAQ